MLTNELYSPLFTVSNSEYRSDQVAGQTLQMDLVYKKMKVVGIFSY